MYRTYLNLLEWSKALEEKRLEKIGRVNEVCYDHSISEHVLAKTYEYSGGVGNNWHFRRFKSTAVKSEPCSEEGVMPCIDSRDTNDDACTATRMKGGDRGEEGLGGTAPVLTIENDEGRDGVTTGGRGGEHIWSKQRRDASFIGAETGVVVWSRSHLRRMARRCKLVAGSVVEDEKNVMQEKLLEMNGTCDEEAILTDRTCVRCKRIVLKRKERDIHEKKCEVHVGQMSVADRAPTMAMLMVQSREIKEYQTGEKNSVLDAAKVTQYTRNSTVPSPVGAMPEKWEVHSVLTTSACSGRQLKGGLMKGSPKKGDA